MSWINRINAHCKEATMLSVQKEQGDLSWPQSIKLWVHLLYCESCRRFVKQSAVITSALKEYNTTTTQNPHHRLSVDVKELMKKKINDALGKQ